jgi:hypothetical protein
MRVSIELGMSGCMAEARSILRDAIEFVAHAHRMLSDPQLQVVWLNKADEAQAFKEAFERNKKDNLFKGLDELHATWGTLSEIGSHATLNSMCERLTADKPDAQGNATWRLTYSGMEPRRWAMSLFSMLLTCFTMERTLYGDYEARLKLDYELVNMREIFEEDKERLRTAHIARYHIEPPTLSRKM